LPPSAAEIPPGTELLIERIGHLGDGLATALTGTVTVPLTAPGDLVVWDGNQWRLATRGGGHRSPPCIHYGVCGGCDLQHLTENTYREAKRQWVVTALERQGIDAPVAPLIAMGPGTRRRATMAVRRDGHGTQVGFQGRRNHDIVAVPECLILRPRIRDALPILANMIAPRLRQEGVAKATVTEAENGLDLAIDGPAMRALETAEIAEAEAAGFISISWNGEILLRLAQPHLTFSGTRVDVPPGAFVQASAEAQGVLVGLVRDATAGARVVGDLYCGLGPFTFALARQAKLFAYEGDAAATACLSAAARRATGLKPVVAERRDLTRRPLLPVELARFEAVVLDPPRGGAELQVRALARSRVPRIASVSCHPASFARDARLLIEGGYRLRRVTPIDQFVWSHHVELMGAFARE
jgi:23S rRNA (uracil1939-C5)-methyltransferase